MTNPLSLVADIGGTASRLALAQAGCILPGSTRRFENDAAGDPHAMLAAYLAEARATPTRACIAAAGPVQGDRVTLTNRAWTLDATAVRAATGIPEITLMNDLQAMGHALAVPEIAGGPLGDTRLTLAIGTGMNMAVAHPMPDGRAFVPPCEAGYLALPFTRAEDAPLLAALAQDFGAPVIEAALSGAGLERLHRLMTGDRLSAAQITAEDSPTRRMALRLLGRYLASLALAHLPRGGIYLAGSVGRALYPHLGHPEFSESFLDAGAYRPLLEAISLKVIASDDAPLHGLARHMA